MAKIQKRDYFFGAALSLLLSKNKDARPSLIDCGESSCQYRLSTDTSEDFILYMKYASSGSIRAGERIWQFSLSDTDKERIRTCVDSGLAAPVPKLQVQSIPKHNIQPHCGTPP